MPQHAQTIAGRRFYAATITIALAIGALQMFHVHGGLLTDYGADVFGTAWLYAMIRQGSTIIRTGKSVPDWLAAAIVFAGCAGSEFGQRLHWVPGRFDPYDLVAYAVTVIVCVAIDRGMGPLAVDNPLKS